MTAVSDASRKLAAPPTVQANPAAAGAAGMPPLHRQVRWWILSLLLLAMILSFVDRQALSLVAPILRNDLGLSATQYGQIVSLFMLGMLVGEFPMGWVMDRFGPRKGLTFAVVSWSIANALHALARSALSFGLFRFWLGTGECGSTSGSVKVVSQWFPTRERGFALGVFNSGSMLGAMIAAPLVAAITLTWGWRMAFVVPSAVGLVWLILWQLVYRAPGQHPRLTAAEAHYIRDGAETADDDASLVLPSSRSLLSHRNTWALMLCRGLVGPVVHFYLFWLPEYLFRERGMSLKEIGLFAWIPFVCGDIGSLTGGWLAGRLITTGMPVFRARAVPLLIGAVLCVASLGVGYAGTATGAIAAICVVLFGHTFISANMFASVSDMFPSNAAARVTALTGIAGAVTGLIFPTLTGFLVDRVSYQPIFFMVAVMPLLGVTGFLLLGRGPRRVSPSAFLQ